MADTIKIGNLDISAFKVGSADCKVYLGDTLLYPHLQEPCFAVVDNISTYTARTYVDVYETSSDKWYKLNNLTNYEEYGIYGSGRTTTYYEGKLTIDGDYEYQYSGSSWVNVGEISGDTPYDYSQNYLTLQALESGTIGFSAGTVDYSTDSGSTWNTLAQGNTISVSQGDEVLFKKSGSVPTENYGIGTFTSSCRFNVYGNIMSMQEGDNFATATTIANYKFYFKRLFAQSKVVSAENMVLPATTLRNFCYNELFKGSAYLTTPPKIFPATALTQDCYSYAFNGCTSLIKTPILPALTAARASYGWMFQNCTSLSEVSCLATDVSAEYATYDWLKNVASSGTFYKNPNASWSRGTSGIPNNWSMQDYVEPSPSYEYPVYYDEIQDPPNNLSFSSMTEAESYECPWVGMKATIDGENYIFSGDSQSGYEWIYQSSRLPDGYTEVEYIRNSNYNAYINTGVIPYDNTSNRFTVTAKLKSEYHSNLACATIIACEEVNSPYYGFGYRYRCSAQQDVLEFFGADGTVSKTSAATSDNTVTVTFTKTANSSKTMDVPLYIFGACGNASYTSATRYSDSTLYSMSVVKNNETVREFVPAKRDSDSVYGLYDLITDTFYTSPNGNNFIGGQPV